ncbi:hypothetical protein QC763_402710 [Podospora pseudopauciseta]|uniref:Uncharacterized protein n=2 Tax=Podospora TaxID=5144 RepID=A0ABR0HC30_9PEZI|nr:hypothetical protein QC763_402710 [Podospora pseudopauciseta]KAK4676721.1 hypothetical protein QC764_402710 [Podospora pseudoanserina]
MSADSHELLDAFRAAALSVTKLYKTSAAAQTKSRADGYQDCLEDLIAFLDKENIGLSAGDVGSKIRKWAMDRSETRDTTPPSIESDDETEKPEPAASSPQAQRTSPPAAQTSVDRDEVQMRDSAPPVLATVPCPPSPIVEEVDFVVPTQDTFNFQSAHAYPHDEAMRLANLNLSDANQASNHSTSNRTTPRNTRRRDVRPGRTRRDLGQGAGHKRKMNLAEYFDLNGVDLGNGKDMFGGGKRTRHV